MKKRIYIKTWLKLKPYTNHTKIDNYYLGLCNDVKSKIVKSEQFPILNQYINGEDLNILSCFLTSYFEDLISETNIWTSFISLHKKLYNKPLPFYSTNQYFNQEVNTSEVCFLIWYFINTKQKGKFTSPLNGFIVNTARDIAKTFDQAWEYAPENEHLKSFYQIDENETDYYVARNLIQTILYKTYLFYPDTLIRFENKQSNIIENNSDDENVEMYLNDNMDNTTHKIHTRLLSLQGKEWAAKIIGNNHKLSDSFSNLSSKISGLFLYKGQDENNFYIEHIASSKKFNLTKKSFDDYGSFKDIDTILYLGIVSWKNEWWFSGVFFQQAFNANTILDEKNSIKSRMAVNFLESQKKDTEKMLKKQLLAFKNYNNGSQIAFLPSDKVDEFFKGFIAFFNNSLNLSKKEIKEADKRAKQDGFFGFDKDLENNIDKSETALAFFNPNSGLEIANYVNSAFPLLINPYFNEADSDNHVARLLLDESYSTELTMYCIDLCKTRLSFFNKGIEKEYLKDIDFLLRFWKNDNYHSSSAVTHI